MAAIVRGNAHAAYTQSSTGQDIPSHQVVVLGDGEGNLLRSTAAGDGTSFLGGAVNLVTLTAAGGPYTAAQSPSTFSTAGVSSLAFDVTVTSFNGGTAPSIQFFIDRLGADGVWYNILQSQTFTAAGTNSADIGPGFSNSFSPPNGVQHAVLTQQARLRWVFAGTAQPTSVVFSASVVGR